jgi:hypothetical protein
MTNVLQRLPVACPYHLAEQYLAGIVAPSVESGRTDRIELAAPIDVRDRHVATVVKAVDVTYGRGEDPMHFDQVWIVKWTPHGGGLYPTFTGTLTVRSDEDYNGCVLELAGEYEPPMGALGAAFDAIVGSRLAAGTASELLRAVGERLTERYRENEASKKVSQ